MRVKKLISIVTAFALVLCLAACGGGKNSESGGEDKAGSGELNVAIWDANQEPGIQEILKISPLKPVLKQNSR